PEPWSLASECKIRALELIPEQRRQKTLEALGVQLETLARSSPVLMIFEDAQWGDPTSLEAFGRMVDPIDRVSGAVEASRKPGMPLSILSNIARKAPLGSLFV